MLTSISRRARASSWALLLGALTAASSEAQRRTLTIDSLRAGRSNIAIAANSEGRVIIAADDGFVSRIWAESEPASARSWARAVDSVAAIRVRPRVAETITFEGPAFGFGHSVTYNRHVTTQNLGGHVLRFSSYPLPGWPAALTHAQLRRVLAAMSRAADVADSLGGGHVAGISDTVVNPSHAAVPADVPRVLDLAAVRVVATVRADGVDFPYPGYLENVARQIMLRFNPPRDPTRRGEAGFLIHRDGSISELSIRRPSASVIDAALQRAIEQTAREGALGPLPRAFANDVLPTVFSFAMAEPQTTPAYFEFQVEKQAAPVGRMPEPQYPPALRSAQVEGEVLVQFVVDTLGRVEMPTLKEVRSSHEMFTRAVRELLPTVQFQPAEIGGRKVRQLVQMPFMFSLAR